MQVPSCRVPSSEASKKTLLRRSHHLAKARESISGGASVVQLQSEIRCLSKEDRQEILKGANLPIIIPTEHVLAMKADLSLPWAKLRVISRLACMLNTYSLNLLGIACTPRWLKTLNISLASEAKQRTLAKTLVDEDNLIVEEGAFTFSKGLEIRSVPFTYVPSIIAKVADFIAAHERYA